MNITHLLWHIKYWDNFFMIIKVFNFFFKYPITNASNWPLSVNDKTKIQRKGYVVFDCLFFEEFFGL